MAGPQYIATFNDDQIEPLGAWLDESTTQFNDVVTSNVVLRLTDDRTENKLLGQSLDLRYDAGES